MWGRSLVPFTLTGVTAQVWEGINNFINVLLDVWLLIHIGIKEYPCWQKRQRDTLRETPSKIGLPGLETIAAYWPPHMAWVRPKEMLHSAEKNIEEYSHVYIARNIIHVPINSPRACKTWLARKCNNQVKPRCAQILLKVFFKFIFSVAMLMLLWKKNTRIWIVWSDASNGLIQIYCTTEIWSNSRLGR